MKIEMILKCVALCRCSGKVVEEKVVGFYPRLHTRRLNVKRQRSDNK